jgi:hypothetical protein
VLEPRGSRATVCNQVLNRPVRLTLIASRTGISDRKCGFTPRSLTVRSLAARSMRKHGGMGEPDNISTAIRSKNHLCLVNAARTRVHPWDAGKPRGASRLVGWPAYPRAFSCRLCAARWQPAPPAVTPRYARVTPKKPGITPVTPLRLKMDSGEKQTCAGLGRALERHDVVVGSAPAVSRPSVPMTGVAALSVKPNEPRTEEREGL